MTQLVKKNEDIKETVKSTDDLCKLLAQSPHYKKMGYEGILAIAHTAKAAQIPVPRALNGGMYFVKGRVEVSAFMMNEMIRSKGHSITMGKSEDPNTCILHGKRKDNGDTMSASFSFEEAKRAGLVRPNSPWITYTQDMLFARALSRLGRRLFPDCLCGCYAEGEISIHAETVSPVKEEEVCVSDIEVSETQEKSYKAISQEQYDELEQWFEGNHVFREQVLKVISAKPWFAKSIQELPVDLYPRVLKKAKELFMENQRIEEQYQGEQNVV